MVAVPGNPSHPTPIAFVESSRGPFRIGMRQPSEPGRHRPGRFATLEMRIDHTDERLELANIHGNGSLEPLAICRLAKLHAMHQIQLL